MMARRLRVSRFLIEQEGRHDGRARRSFGALVNHLIVTPAEL